MTVLRSLMVSLLALMLAPVASADSPVRSPRPEPRPPSVEEVQVRIPLVPVSYHATIRPRPRPHAASPSAVRPAHLVLVGNAPGLRRSIRPAPRPGQRRRAPIVEVTTGATRTQPTPAVTLGRKGSVCGDRAIRGQAMSPIAGRLKGCGVAKPVRVTSVDGVALSQPSIMDCTTARALKQWVQKGAKPAVGRLGGGIGSLRVAAHYACRTRNSQRGAKISEHGKGRAVDISAIVLRNGVSLSVLKGWRDRTQGKVLKRMHKAACGPFGTVLGPEADRHHRDHFHFDTARYRSGSYCR